MPKDLNHLITRVRKQRNTPTEVAWNSLQIKVCMYQLFAALDYVHEQEICHRDIKPNNLLYDPNTLVLKLCDFGSAKKLVPDQTNVAYICARFYRAPELLFGATKYTNKIGKTLGQSLFGDANFSLHRSLVYWRGVHRTTARRATISR